MHTIKKIGLGLFLLAMGLFVLQLFLTGYKINDETLPKVEAALGEKEYTPYVVQSLAQWKDKALGGKFSYLPTISEALQNANYEIAQVYGIPADQIPNLVSSLTKEENGKFKVTAESHAALKALLPAEVGEYVSGGTTWLIDREYDDKAAFTQTLTDELSKKGNEFAANYQVSEGSIKDIKFEIIKATSGGFFWNNRWIFFLLIIVGGTIGALMYIYPAFFDGNPGIKHNHIYFNSATNQGLIGIIAAVFLITFYILLYFNHFWIAEWISLADPIAKLIKGQPADRWFMYGFLYTLAIWVMGIRMFAKYRHSRYHQVRTASIMFFQTAFAFIIPEILVLLNQPYMDLKNAWPLNYNFFFDYNIDNHITAGNFGIWMLGWGIALFAIGVPLFTYFYGKRWYCSWVCGCGGLAETLGDPYRQLSDKTTEAWQIERFIIHGVLAFAIIMTSLVLYSYFSESGVNLSFNKWSLLALVWAVGAGLYALHRRKFPHMSGRKVLTVVLVFAGAFTLGVFTNFFPVSGNNITFNSFDVRSVYGFAIGSIFAGVVGTGFYPVMGNRVWCRFGCPLAAYLGLVQRFKSRFRITTNGGQCISCGNCSTYCEMGIDVRAYAQKGQNIVRSSCVGCGVCAAVCPRGVLSLENDDNTDTSRMSDVRY
ncbi:MAG: 4Fe-4S binding protein [Bacteroidia bacterium]|nr:4Fe-4S binding protein [Bacteroidia bacterium]